MWGEPPINGIISCAKTYMKDAKAYISAEDPIKRRTYEAERRELVARQHLSHQREIVVEKVELLEERQGTTSCIDGLDTTAITRKSIKLRNKYLTQRFKYIINEEQIALRANMTPQVTAKAIKGALIYRTDVAKGHKNSQIISEGEHRALALASFLAEARSISDDTPIVIDDPVSSLDQARRMPVAKRIVQEARRRQVIVFTHDVYSLQF